MPTLGIDIGTQSLKVVVLDDDLKVMGSAQYSYDISFPCPGWAEQSPQLWIDALKPAIGGALASAGLPGSAITAMAVCGQLDGCVPVDTNGTALAPAIIWMDRRATAEIEGLDSGLILSRAGLVLDATHMGAKIAWFSRHFPDRSRVAMWHQPVTFLAAALTEQSVISHSLASTTMLLGINTFDWDDELLAAFHADRRTLPTLVEECAIAGALTARGALLTGLREGTPVAVGTGDDFSNPLGCGIVEPGTLAVSLGTAETVAALADEVIIDPQMLVETHAYPGGRYHLGNPGWLAGGSVRWAKQLLSIETDEAFSALASTAPPGCAGLTFIPALNGAMAPKWIVEARGSFIGLTTSHGPAHLARAVLEGTAFAMRDVLERLKALGVPTDRLRLMGGGARSDLWCAIRADLTGRPADVLYEADASAIGAGMIAAVATGSFADIASACASLPQTLREVRPNAAMSSTYEDAYQLYVDRFAALEPTWS